MHSKLFVCAISASLVAAAPHSRRSASPQDFGDIVTPGNPDIFSQFNEFIQIIPQITEFFSNPENLQAFNIQPDALAAVDGNELSPEDFPAPPPEEAPVVEEVPAADENLLVDNPPPAEEVAPPPPPPEDDSSDSDSDDDGPSDIAQIGNLAGDVITEDDATGDLIGAGIDLIGSIFRN